MAIGLTQSITGGNPAVNSYTFTLGSNAAAGAFLALQTSVFVSGGPANATPTGGGTWSTTTAPGVQAEGNSYISYCPSATGGATAVVIDYGTSFYIEGCLSEWSGMHATPLDQQTQNDFLYTDTTPTVGPTGTTAQADELVLAVLGCSYNSTNVGIDACTT